MFYLDVILSIICNFILLNFFYILLFVVNLPLFVCLCVFCVCDDHITYVLYKSR